MYDFKTKQPKWVEADEAILNIAEGKRIVVGSGCVAPQHLIKTLVSHHSRFYDNEVCHILTFGEAPYSDPKYSQSFRHNGFFIGHNVREYVNAGNADYIPVFLHDVPYLFLSKQLPVHCVMVNVSPPDKHGYVTLGTSIDILPAAIASAEMVIAQVNRYVPHTHGPCRVPLKVFDYVVEHDEPLMELFLPKCDEVSETMGKYIASQIKDGATLQLGIGNIPDACLRNLTDKNDMGIHTEMFSDGAVDLCRAGNINNMRKHLNPGKSITSFVLGSKKVFDFVDENPEVEFWPTEYTNDILNIAQNDNMVSVNSAIQVDLGGQVCSDSIGGRIYSGFGGQVDFVRGAKRSKGGKSFIALPSTARNGQVSRIVPTLTENSGVVTSRADVQYVVTEYGVAYLHGRNLRERGLALTEIAHPDFRPELLAALKNRKIVSMSQTVPLHDDRDIRYCIPKNQKFKDQTVYFRPLKSDDVRILQDFFYSHQQETIRFRYHQFIKSLPLDEAKQRVSIDYNQDMAIAGFASDEPYAEMLCVARYYDIGSGVAEIGIVVREDLQNLHIGTFMLAELIDTAKKQGKNKLIGHVLFDNTMMLSVFKKMGFAFEPSKQCQGQMCSLEL